MLLKVWQVKTCQCQLYWSCYNTNSYQCSCLNRDFWDHLMHKISTRWWFPLIYIAETLIPNCQQILSTNSTECLNSCPIGDSIFVNAMVGNNPLINSNTKIRQIILIKLILWGSFWSYTVNTSSWHTFSVCII
jgi:hypothetical protein